MKKNLVSSVIIGFLILCSFSTLVNAEKVSKDDPFVLYQQGVSKGIINKDEVSFDNWKKMEQVDLHPVYDNAINNKLIDEKTSYNSWLEDNNYGVFPEMGNKFVKIELRGSQSANKKKFIKTVRKGDIMVVHDYKNVWCPYIGHAAIATTNNYILDMPGYKSGAHDKKDNNTQRKKENWINEYIGGWTTIYRLKNKSLANDIATWADWRYWSSSHSLKKNRHVTYTMKTKLKDDYSHAYCSKLVWQALYYGSGSKKVVYPHASTGIVAPYLLRSKIRPAYAPSNMGTF